MSFQPTYIFNWLEITSLPVIFRTKLSLSSSYVQSHFNLLEITSLPEQNCHCLLSIYNHTFHTHLLPQILNPKTQLSFPFYLRSFATFIALYWFGEDASKTKREWVYGENVVLEGKKSRFERERRGTFFGKRVCLLTKIQNFLKTH